MFQHFFGGHLDNELESSWLQQKITPRETIKISSSHILHVLSAITYRHLLIVNYNFFRLNLEDQSCNVLIAFEDNLQCTACVRHSVQSLTNLSSIFVISCNLEIYSKTSFLTDDSTALTDKLPRWKCHLFQSISAFSL